MALFGKKTQLVRLAIGFLCSAAVSGVALRADNTLKLAATSTLLNPCNSELVSGPVDVELVVAATENQNGVHVKVHRSFHGTLTGNQDNSYKVSSMANAKFDALAPFYDLTFENNVIGLGQAPDFTVTGNLRVFVNANQEPTGYSASAVAATCK